MKEIATLNNKGTYINSYIAQLRPAHSMIEVVFAEVIFGEVGNVGELDMGYI